ncbi:MAG: hypothetical protein LBC82_01200 [Oscillospiraceae bacterium]|jgi:hypothetical protein|nr:hypothetical protein [Oscillospiraceae bacterium]
MSKGGAKALRREKARKKAKRIKILVVCGCVLVVAALVATGIYLSGRESEAEVYNAGYQTVRLFSDGRFTAVLGHNVMKSGTYTKSSRSGAAEITFNSGGRTEVGWLENNELRIPAEWEDGCGHGNILQRR